MADAMVTITGIDGADGLNMLVADLQREARIAPEETRKVVQRGLWNIKKDWQKRWAGLAHAPRLPAAITYETKQLGGRVDGEVGPDKDRPQGALGNLIEFGSVNNSPNPGGAPALQAEQPRFEKAMQDLAFRDRSWR